MERGRKPAPVAVHHFPRRRARVAARSSTQTIPEFRLEEDSPTESGERSEAEGPHRRRRSSERVEAGGAAEFADLMSLGHALFEAGRVSEARVVFEGLVAAGHRDAFCRTMLGVVCLAQKDLERALALFDEALAIDPSDLAALVYRGELRLKRKKPGKAVKDLERAVALGPADDPFVERAQRLLVLARKASAAR
jgi:tetratricopeptide (TPR) repeat protein